MSALTLEAATFASQTFSTNVVTLEPATAVLEEATGKQAMMFCRFAGLTIARNSTITKVTLKVWVPEGTAAAARKASLTVEFENTTEQSEGDAEPFKEENNNLGARTRYKDSSTWKEQLAAGKYVSFSTGIAAALEKVTSQSNWVSGKHLVLCLIQTSGTETVTLTGAAHPPVLEIEYTESTGVAIACSATASSSATCALTAKTGVPVNPAVAASVSELAVNAKTQISAQANSESTATLTTTAPTRVVTAGANSTSGAECTLHAPTSIAAKAEAASAAELAVTAKAALGGTAIANSAATCTTATPAVIAGVATSASAAEIIVKTTPKLAAVAAAESNANLAGLTNGHPHIGAVATATSAAQATVTIPTHSIAIGLNPASSTSAAHSTLYIPLKGLFATLDEPQPFNVALNEQTKFTIDPNEQPIFSVDVE